ncbi:MAG: hypothetical protein BWY38_02979 [Ignavibacteria bacterium ADurb.Bin266]|nr:MAG: hypothetical protein BWY38_02979 [Ignavibacteria bacterium ADurb.Bin266]
MNIKIKQILNGLKWLWILLIICFAVYYCYKNSYKINNALNLLPVLSITISIAMIIAAKLFLGLTAYYSVRYTGKAVSFPKCFIMYNTTQMAKYIPGSIWQFVSRAATYSNEGFSVRQIRNSIMIETGWVLSGAFVIGIVFITFTNSMSLLEIYNKFSFIINIIILAFCFCAAASVLFFRKRLHDNLRKIISKKNLNLRMFFVEIVIWLLLGSSFSVLLYCSSVMTNEWLYVIGLYSLSYFIGFLVPFAPAGLGVREGILVLGLSHSVPQDTAITIAGINRIMYFSVEVVLAVISYCMIHYGKNRVESKI